MPVQPSAAHLHFILFFLRGSECGVLSETIISVQGRIEPGRRRGILFVRKRMLWALWCCGKAFSCWVYPEHQIPHPLPWFYHVFPHASFHVFTGKARSVGLIWYHLSSSASSFSPLCSQKGQGIFLAVAEHHKAFTHHFQHIPRLRSSRKNLLRLISVSGHSSHSYVPGQCQWAVLHGRALLCRLEGQVSHVQKETV